MLAAILSFLAAALLTVSATMAGLGMYSQDFYAGEGGSYGVASYCRSTEPVEPVGEGSFTLLNFCALSWGKLETASELAAMILLFIALCSGAVCMIYYLATCFGRACFRPKRWISGIALWMSAISCLGNGGALLAIAGTWGWKTPAGTSVGTMFYLVGLGCATAFIGFLLGFCILALDKRSARKELAPYMNKSELEIDGNADGATSKTELV